MRLAPRLVLAFGFVATLSVSGVGYVVRSERRESETRRFEQEVRGACDRVVTEIERQGESDRKLIAGACQSGELVDRALIWLEAATLDDERRLALSRLVPEERKAFDLDELLLATGDGDLLGQDPMPAQPNPLDRAQLVAGDASRWALRPGTDPALVARCRKAGAAGKVVALVGERRLAAVAERLGKTIDAEITLGPAPLHAADVSRGTCLLTDGAGAGIPVAVTKPNKALVDSLWRVDQTILYAALASTGVALILAVLLARSLGRPIAELASEARKVASGEARPLRVGGAGEIAELAQAFDTMLDDLEATRRQLAATSRVAAWREVARRVAHEVKNPLAPIRAAVETLRRLRARNDPEFDSYFDEATRTVLGEVHRIASIVTEFTRFARLPPPHPQRVDLVEIVRQVVRLHEHGTSARLQVTVEHVPPLIFADRDQMVQVLTNLLQNALDAVADRGEAGVVRVTIGLASPTHVRVTVSDNGPGIDPAIASRLFDPYATTKQHGTGLGLAIAQRIAVEHEGELSCISASAVSPAERGAVFCLVLPLSPRRSGEADLAENEPDSRANEPPGRGAQ
ncbi:MAG: ATP-binding protein [Myxococcota bacterium]|nr:ATP-binding protein [Myxococcota bacterium]